MGEKAATRRFASPADTQCSEDEFAGRGGAGSVEEAAAWSSRVPGAVSEEVDEHGEHTRQSHVAVEVEEATAWSLRASGTVAEEACGHDDQTRHKRRMLQEKRFLTGRGGAVFVSTEQEAAGVGPSTHMKQAIKDPGGNHVEGSRRSRAADLKRCSQELRTVAASTGSSQKRKRVVSFWWEKT